ncbi:uncharacterized protein LOC135373447 [Ornithodoros turicata]|uniref:uncharacterized protein LOC135373447 n=1 Tax=Ornithodoros turicata TaxID=34597 RepID=UPI003138AA15
MEYVSSNKRTKKLVLDGFVYAKQKALKAGIRWRCVKRDECKEAVIESCGTYSVSVTHSHPGDDAAVSVLKARNKIKEITALSNEKPASVVRRVLQDLSAEEKARMTSEDSIKRSIRQQRALSYPPDPEWLADLVIEEEWRTTGGIQPELFLFHDNGPAADTRLLVFGTEDCLRALADSDYWFMDGTFDFAPKNFTQLYVILVPLGEAAVPVVYALMEKKTQACYEELLRAVTSKCTSLGVTPDPEIVVTDFEKASMNAVKEVIGSEVKTQ